jgi:hypothetical protein
LQELSKIHSDARYQWYWASSFKENVRLWTDSKKTKRNQLTRQNSQDRFRNWETNACSCRRWIILTAPHD